MTPLADIPIFFHIASLWWGFCIYMLTGAAFSSHRFTTRTPMGDQHRHRARHRAICIALAATAALALITFVSVFLPADMRGALWPA